MFVYKCDICKKEIKDQEVTVRASQSNAFCRDCAKPVLAFLKKHKLVEKN